MNKFHLLSTFNLHNLKPNWSKILNLSNRDHNTVKVFGTFLGANGKIMAAQDKHRVQCSAKQHTFLRQSADTWNP